MISVTVTDEWNGKRIDAAAAGLTPDFSRAMIQRIIEAGGMQCNGKVCSEKRTLVKTGDVLEFESSANQENFAKPEDIDLDILYEDDSLMVIAKPAGMVVHPGAGNHSGTVVNAVLGHESSMLEGFENTDPTRHGIVHRLDKDTSGCLVIAKTEQAMFKLCRAFAARVVSKTYLAIVAPAPRVQCAEIKTYIGRHPVNRKKMAVVRDERQGKFAHSVFTVERSGKIGTVSAALVKVRIMTGRTHQIRVHMSHYGCPVIGDSVYGGNSRIAAERQMLHAWRISFPHPDTGVVMTFEAPLPADFEHYLQEMKPL